MTDLFLIAAMAHGNIIGRDNDMPWKGRFKADMQHFKNKTTGHPIIMGRKTHNSLGMILPNRQNIVVSRDVNFKTPYKKNTDLFFLAVSLSAAIEKARSFNDEKIFVIGGADLYAQALPLANGMHLTYLTFNCENPSDPAYKKFPSFNEADWRIEAENTVTDGADVMRFVTYRRQ